VNARHIRIIVSAFALELALAGAAGAQERTPQPYLPDEFQAWMKAAWRAEAVFIGSFPFTLFATLEIYDTVRYASNNFSPSYAPWPFGSGTAVSYSGEETLWLVASAISLSMVISGIDFLLGRVNERSPPG
jgi:hypothetical protein